MILDLQTTFSGTVAYDGTRSGQAITASAMSQNVLELRAAGSPVTGEGIIGSDLWLIVRARTSAAGADAAKTLTIKVLSDNSEGLATAPVEHLRSAPIPGAALVAGAVVMCVQLSEGNYKRFLGLSYEVSAAFTSFQLEAFMSDSPQRNRHFPTAITIDT